MVTKDEALKMAIEDAMKFVNTLNGYEDANQSKPFKTEADKYLSYASVVIKSLATSLKEALAQPAQDLEQAPCEQPVAWLYKRENSSGGWYVVTNYEKENDNGSRNIECYDIPLYTHPAPSWQGLSDDDIDKIYYKTFDTWSSEVDIEFSRAIEQALKEKNHG